MKVTLMIDSYRRCSVKTVAQARGRWKSSWQQLRATCVLPKSRLRYIWNAAASSATTICFGRHVFGPVLS